MEPDDLTAVWRRYDARLGELVWTNALILRRSSLAATRTTLGRLRVTLVYEVVVSAIAVLWLGAFVADHFHEAPVFAATAVLDVYAIAILAGTIAQLATLGQVDFDQPVVAIARVVDRLTLFRARQSMGTLVLAPLMWAPLAIVATRGLLGIDAVAAFGVPWIVVNVAFGVAVLALGLWLARRYGTGANAAPWFRRFSESLSGNAVRSAAAELRTLQRYEDEMTVA
jgi:hypothetical protein